MTTTTTHNDPRWALRADQNKTIDLQDSFFSYSPPKNGNQPVGIGDTSLQTISVLLFKPSEQITGPEHKTFPS